MAENDLEIIIEDDAAPTVIVEEKKDGPTLEEAISKLTADLEVSKRETASERVARETAERRVSQAVGRVAEATKSAKDGELTLVVNAIETIQQQQDMSKATLAAAWTAGDFTQAAEIQEQIAKNAARLQQLESGKTILEEEAKRPPPRQERPDPVEHIAQQLSPRSAQWIRQHPEFARDNAMYERVVRADSKAYGEGLERDTPEYFAHVEKTLGLHSDDSRSEPRRVEAQPSAAPSGARKNPGEENPKTVRLTRDQIEAAESSGMTPQEYAKHLQALKAEGRMQ